jgi:type II secretory pathway pseudopilin PulG
MRDPSAYAFANMYGNKRDDEKEKEAKKAGDAYRKAQESFFKDSLNFPLVLPSPEEDEEKKWGRPIQPYFSNPSPLEMGLGGYSIRPSLGMGGGVPYGLGGRGMPSIGYNPFAGQRQIMPQGYANISTVNVQYSAPDGTLYQMSMTAPMQNRPYALGNLLMGLYALMTAEGRGYEGGGKAGGKGGGYSGAGSGGFAGGKGGGK